MFDKYEDLELWIGRKQGDEYPIEVRSPAGEASSSMVFSVGMYEEALERLRSFRVDEDFLKDFGGCLYRGLFKEPIRRRYAQSLGMVGVEEGLRIRLRIDPPELARLPWELLYDGDETRTFLAPLPKTPLTRYIALPQPPMPLEIKRPLKILFVIANPTDLTQFDVAETQSSMNVALEPLIESGSVDIEFLEDATRKAFQSRLRKDFHVLHYIGHGGFDEDLQRGCLAFKDVLGQSHLIDAEMLAYLLSGSTVRLVILTACESARTSEVDFLMGVAQALVNAGVPAVVAMQFKVLYSTAMLFSIEFYSALADNRPIDACVAEARKAILTETGLSRLDWGIPVLFMRSPDGRILDVVSLDEVAKIPSEFRVDEQELNKLREVYVKPEQYDKARQLIEKNKRLIITGPAHVGKASMARFLGLELRDRTAGIDQILTVPRHGDLADILSVFKTIRNSVIIIDDAFEPTRFGDEEIGNAMGQIKELAETNFVIMTSKKAVIEIARRETDLEEEEPIDGFLIELEFPKGYSKAKLKDILDRHIKYALNAGRISEEQRTLLDAQLADVIPPRPPRRLRFPPQINYLIDQVSLKNVQTREELLEAVEAASDIQRAVRKWFSNLGDDEKYFVFTLGLFAGLDEKSFWKIYRGIVVIINELVSSKVGTPPLVDVRRSAIPYVTVSGNLEFSDPDYQSAILNEIKERKEYLFEILPFLRDKGRKEGRENKVIRIAVALAVGEIGKLDLQEVEDLVLREWAMDEDMSIRAAVGHCFKHVIEDSSKIGDVFSLIKEWAENEDWHIRWSAVSALGRIGRTKLGSALSQLRILARDENKEVRQGVAYVLARLGMSRQIKVERIMPILETLARDPEGEVRARVSFGLLDITRNKPPKRKTVLLNLKEWARDENKYARWVASRGLVEMSKEKQDDVLPIMKGLAKEEANIAQTLASVLAAALKGEFAEVLPRDILPTIKSLTQDEDESAQLVAISALIAASEEKPEDILQILEEWIHSEDWRIRRVAVFVLVEIAVQINQERALGLLGALARDENESVRAALLSELDRVELAKTCPESVASMIRGIARDERREIKLDAISILQTISGISPMATLPVLEKLSDDEDERIRLMVVSLLQEVMPENPREALLILGDMAKDGSPDVRLAIVQVVKTVSGVWPREILPILTTLAGDEDENVRKVVEAAISEVNRAAPGLVSLILKDLARNENWSLQNALGCLSAADLARFVWYRAFAGVPETLTEPPMVPTKPAVSEQKWYQMGETERTFQRERTLLLGKGYPFSVKGSDDYLYYIISLRNEDSDTLRIYLACSRSYPETPPECAIELNDKEVLMDLATISNWGSGCNLSELVDEVVSRL